MNLGESTEWPWIISDPVTMAVTQLLPTVRWSQKPDMTWVKLSLDAPYEDWEPAARYLQKQKETAMNPQQPDPVDSMGDGPMSLSELIVELQRVAAEMGDEDPQVLVHCHGCCRHGHDIRGAAPGRGDEEGCIVVEV